MKYILLLVLVPFSLFSQVQIGDDIDGEVQLNRFGGSVAISSDGTIFAAGADFNFGSGFNSGHVRLYENINNAWIQLGQDIDGEAAYDNSGWSVALSSNGLIVAIGAINNDDNGDRSGHVRVYGLIDNEWEQIGQDIAGEGEVDQSGRSIALSDDGTIVAIGAMGNDSDGAENKGHVRVYRNVSDSWVQIGEDIDGENAYDNSGGSISISSDGTTIAIGATGYDANGLGNTGHVRIFENSNDTWVQVGADIYGAFEYDNSGGSVSLSSDGMVLAIGSLLNDGNGEDSGHVRVFQNSNNNWIQMGSDIEGKTEGERSGFSISLSSDGLIISIGATLNNENGEAAGVVRIYRFIEDHWEQLGDDINGEAEGDNFGKDVSLSSDGLTLAIGAYNNDGNGNNSGHVRVYDLTELISSNEDIILSQINLFPNPTGGEFQIQLPKNIKLEKAEIYNSLGQKVLNIRQKDINVNTFEAGSYIVNIVTNQGNVFRKLIKY